MTSSPGSSSAPNSNSIAGDVPSMTTNGRMACARREITSLLLYPRAVLPLQPQCAHLRAPQILVADRVRRDDLVRRLGVVADPKLVGTGPEVGPREYVQRGGLH